MIVSYELFKMGALYLDTVSQPISNADTSIAQYNGETHIDIADIDKAHPDCTITWIKPGNSDFLIADRVLLTNVSWKKLDEQLFQDGRFVSVNGWDYTCMMPSVDGKGGEWEQTIYYLWNSSKKVNELLHWRDACTIGRTVMMLTVGTVKTMSDSHINWRQVMLVDIDEALPFAGFRPILKPIGPKVFTSGSVVTLEGQRFGWRQENLRESSAHKLQFQPILYPINNKKTGTEELVDNALFSGINTMRAYTLLMNGKPVRTDGDILPYKKNAHLDLTDRYYGNEYLIPWVVKYGCAYVGKPLLRSIDLTELGKQNLM